MDSKSAARVLAIIQLHQKGFSVETLTPPVFRVSVRECDKSIVLTMILSESTIGTLVSKCQFFSPRSTTAYTMCRVFICMCSPDHGILIISVYNFA